MTLSHEEQEFERFCGQLLLVRQLRECTSIEEVHEQLSLIDGHWEFGEAKSTDELGPLGSVAVDTPILPKTDEPFPAQTRLERAWEWVNGQPYTGRKKL